MHTLQNAMSKILVVDDEPESVRSLTSRIGEAGHLLVGTSSAEEARTAMDRELFDLVIANGRLPDGSGLDLLKHVKESTPAVSVIIVTANGSIRWP